MIIIEPDGLLDLVRVLGKVDLHHDVGEQDVVLGDSLGLQLQQLCPHFGRFLLHEMLTFEFASKLSCE